MSTPLLERLTLLDPQAGSVPGPAMREPGPHRGSLDPCESTDGPVEVLKVRCSAGCWYTVLADDLSPATDR